MIPSNQLSVILAIAAGVWGALLIWSGVSFDKSWTGPFSTVSGVVAVALSLFEGLLWRIPWLYPWFVKVPNIRGTWKVVLVSDWVNPETGERPEPIQAFMVVRQTYSTISMRLHTRESSSQLLAGRFIRADDGTNSVTGVYSNVPKLGSGIGAQSTSGVYSLPSQASRPSR